MKFLCIPGAIANAQSFAVLLGPMMKELDGDASFFITQGTIPAPAPPGFDSFFGPEPHVRFWEFEVTQSDDQEKLKWKLDSIRDFPEQASAEDTMRLVLPADTRIVPESVEAALQRLYRIMDEEGPFDGVIGYSEGASVASTLIMDERRRFLKEGREPQIKCGLFFAGWPPVAQDVAKGLLLADESETLIEVPTCHVIGSRDPWIQGSMALYNICDEDTVHLFDHGGGHTLPRDVKTCRELGEVIRTMMVTAECN